MVIPDITPNVLLLDVTVRISKDKDRWMVIPDITPNVLLVGRKIVERGNIETPNTQIHDHSLSWLGTGTPIKVSAFAVVLDVCTC